MAVPAGDGAWVSATMVARFYCTHCGYFLTKAANQREVDEIVRRHIRDYEIVRRHIRDYHNQEA